MVQRKNDNYCNMYGMSHTYQFCVGSFKNTFLPDIILFFVCNNLTDLIKLCLNWLIVISTQEAHLSTEKAISHIYHANMVSI